MKKLFFITASFFTTQVMAQELKIATNTSGKEIKMVSYNKTPASNNIAFFINGVLTSQVSLTEMDPKNIERIEVKKNTICIDNKEFEGQIYIYTKDFIPTVIVKH
ncbi:hypothetical protein [Polluticaenibacter yanchengensis]|uniref:Auto-transporter adhesin head GIN domain-containing protein n=1 Tax=Polluticaenibacter yanchengensis TaxID=3014562 RepID=A0ABT4UGL2_9BACT|nr:hypothetical protein [Chitinophagaceae bacterium LY-5]